MLLWIAVASAAPPEAFVELKEWDACTLYKRERTATTPSAMRAECVWPGVDAVVLGHMMTQYERYDDWIWPVDVSEVRRVQGDRTLVYQLQQIWGINDREVLLWATTTAVPGGIKASWVTAREQPLPARKGAIRTPHNEGFWEITRAETGTRVVHQIEVDAGGVPLPQWLIRAIQSRGLARVMNEVREKALLQAVKK